jgi:single-stranded-DNA-specific exonuclease
MTWDKAEIDRELVKRLASEYNIDLLPAAILARRGVTEGASLAYYLEEDPQYLHNPFLFEDMEDAVDRITTAVSEGEKVLVFGDSDVDGVTATTLMVKTLEELGLEVSWRVPMGEEPYGLTTEAVESFAAEDGTLIVTVDSGISNTEEIARANELGVDVIVTDHHNPQEELPPALALINPKLPDTPYPFSGLCGCAVASKLRWALNFAQTDFYKQQLCLVHARPGNDTVIIDAVRLENMVEVDRMSESLVPGMVRLEDTRFAEFVAGQQVICYEEETQARLMRQVFGDRVEINVLDLAPEVARLFPPLSGKSLLKLREGSKLARYGASTPEEIDVLVAMFQVVVHKWAPELERSLSGVVDLVALGTLADMMPLVDENRIMVKLGLKSLSGEPRPGLRALLDKQRLLGKQRISSRDIGWTVSPSLNAAGRMGEADKAVRLLMSSDPHEVDVLADEVVQLNQKRRTIGDEAWNTVLPQARESFTELGERFVLVQEESVHRGITGILAGRLSRLFSAPAAVITASDGRAIGSIRSNRGVRATELLKACEDLLTEWGGHDEAAGFEAPVEQVEAVLERLRATVSEVEMLEDRQETISIDAELPHRYLSPELEEVVSLLGPFGQQHPPLVFLARSVRVEQLQFIGKEEQHLRFVLHAGKYRWPAVYWNAAERVQRDFSENDLVDVVFEFGKNYYQNRETMQLTVLDLSRVTEE